MSLDKEWSDWLKECSRLHCDPAEIKRRLTSAGFDSDTINEAIATYFPLTTFKGRPELVDGNSITIDGHTVRILARLDSPNAALLDNVVTPAEAQGILSLVKGTVASESLVVDNETGGSVKHEARTSKGTSFTTDDHPLLETLTKRLSIITQWPERNCENIQALIYEVGEHYKPHHDYFDPAIDSSLPHLGTSGQRLGTIVLYLSRSEDGGATRFPNSGISFVPNVGGAVFFSDVEEDGSLSKPSLHSAEPVIKGTKVVMTFWQREKPAR